MLSREAVAILLIVVAIAGAYYFFSEVALPQCNVLTDCDFRECGEGEAKACQSGRCTCLSEGETPQDF